MSSCCNSKKEQTLDDVLFKSLPLSQRLRIKLKRLFSCLACSKKRRIKAQHKQRTQEKGKSGFRRVFKRKKTEITNTCGVPAHIAITPRPIQNLSTLSINRVGSISLDTHGKYLTQEFKIFPSQTKTLMVDSHRFYLTVFLKIDNEWQLLWNCRQVSTSTPIFLLPYHLSEAVLNDPSFQLKTTITIDNTKYTANPNKYKAVRTYNSTRTYI